MSLSDSRSFRDLPGEIRNKIYKILLCTFEPAYLLTPESHERHLANPQEPKLLESHTPPTELIYLRHSIEPQILRTCRAIYNEATYAMRQTNCFIKVIVRIQWADIANILVLKRIPILGVDEHEVKYFKDCVMSHEITWAKPFKPKTFMILRRDLDLFCKGLADYKHMIPRHDKLVSHIVTLLNPYESDNLPGLPEFYTRKLQEFLIAPYRTLRGFPRFTIKGAIPKNLSRVAVQEIKREPGMDPDSFISELEDFKGKGNDFFRSGNLSMASETWCQALLKIMRLPMSREGAQLFKAGGLNFTNRITSLKFNLSSNLAQNTIRAMREDAQQKNFDLLLQREGSFFHSIDNAKHPEIPGSTWEPSPQQAGKLFYREAVGCRLLGQFNRAEIAIKKALSHLPDDIEVKNEKERIIQARKN